MNVSHNICKNCYDAEIVNAQGMLLPSLQKGYFRATIYIANPISPGNVHYSHAICHTLWTSPVISVQLITMQIRCMLLLAAVLWNGIPRDTVLPLKLLPQMEGAGILYVHHCECVLCKLSFHSRQPIGVIVTSMTIGAV